MSSLVLLFCAATSCEKVEPDVVRCLPWIWMGGTVTCLEKKTKRRKLLRVGLPSLCWISLEGVHRCSTINVEWLCELHLDSIYWHVLLLRKNIWKSSEHFLFCSFILCCYPLWSGGTRRGQVPTMDLNRRDCYMSGKEKKEKENIEIGAPISLLDISWRCSLLPNNQCLFMRAASDLYISICSVQLFEELQPSFPLYTVFF